MKLQQEGAGIKMDSVLPHLVLVSDDLLSTGIVVYHLKVTVYTVVCQRSNFSFVSLKKKNSSIFDILFLRLIIIIWDEGKQKLNWFKNVSTVLHRFSNTRTLYTFRTVTKDWMLGIPSDAMCIIPGYFCRKLSRKIY